MRRRVNVLFFQFSQAGKMYLICSSLETVHVWLHLVWRCDESTRDGIGDLSVLGDFRWGGGYGVDADFIVLENTHIAFVETRDIKARTLAEMMSSVRIFNIIYSWKQDMDCIFL